MTTPIAFLRFVAASAALLALAVSPASAADAPAPLPMVAPAAAGFSPARLDALHQSLRAKVDAGLYSGYVSLIARDGQVVDWRAHGYQDVAAGTPMRQDSIVRIYSMSKIVTSVAVLILLEEGKLRLNDPISLYLPELANPKVLVGGTADAPELVDAARPITIDNLLTHTSGYYYDAEWSADPVPCELMRRKEIWTSTSMNDFLSRVAAVPLNEQPGTRYRYGVSTDLLGIIVERISGQPLEQFFSERIFVPLGMVDTAFDVPQDKLGRRAAVHHRGPQGLEIDPLMDWRDLGPTTFRSGGGGLYSTAADYACFAQMLLNGGELQGARILSPKTVELMTTDRLGYLDDPHPFGTPSQGFGLGVRIITDLGRNPMLGSVGTFGWDGAASTNVQIDPEERTVAILMMQHVPFNEDDIHAYWTNGFYSAMTE